MGDYIAVNIETLEQDIKDLEETLASIRGEMNGMFESVSELDKMWDGPANAVFVQQFLTDKGIFEDLCESVDGIIDSMNNAKTTYRKCEANVKSEIDKIKV